MVSLPPSSGGTQEEKRKMTKRTYWLMEQFKINGKLYNVASRKITCEVTGEMSDGTKVWTDTETGHQYCCGRVSGHWYFIEM
jgi:hypothetical protein